MELLSNPFEHELFTPTLIRLAVILFIGAFGIWFASLKSPAKLTKELWLRYFSWVIIAPFFLSSIYCGTLPALFVFVFVTFRAIREYVKVTKLSKAYAVAMYMGIPFTLGALYTETVSILPVIFITLPTLITLKKNNPQELKSLLTTVLGSFWILYLFLHASMLLKLPDGVLLFTLTGFSVALCDIGNFTAGKIFSKMELGTKHIVADKISPDKTYLGYVGGFWGVLFITLLFLPYTQLLAIPHIVLFIIAILVSSSIGDLSESLFKRYYYVKDSSNFIPGHGGVLDRLDSFLPSVTAIFYLSLFIEGV